MFYEKGVLKNFENTHKITYVGVLFLLNFQACDILEACSFVKEETFTQVFSFEFCKNFKNIFFYRNLRWVHLLLMITSKSNLQQCWKIPLVNPLGKFPPLGKFSPSIFPWSITNFPSTFTNRRSYHCVKSVQIPSHFCSLFSCIRTKYRDLRDKSPYSVRIQEKTDQK